ncbi:MAG: hypothetical protein ABSF90_19080 [Syntrophobacteraceae bacterium]|jgi:hypothetical protein
MQSLGSIEYKSHIINIFPDEDAPNPREEFDHLGTMVCFHRRYNLGDRHEFRSPGEFMEFLKEEKPICLPLYLFVHSGATMSTESDRFRACDPQGWDWGMLGYIYVTKENVRTEYNVNRVSRKILEKVTKLLQSEVQEYDHYLTGNVYGYEITKEERQAGKVIDSCWGFFGYPEDYVIPEAKAVIDQIIREAA